jgi:hypothetical protein
MKYSYTVDIALPRRRVVELFDDQANVLKWQPGLTKFESLTGSPGMTGSTARLTYGTPPRVFELIETVTDRRLPDEFSGSYASKMGVTLIRNRFVDQGATTRWVVDTEFVGTGTMRVLAWFMGGMMNRQTRSVVEAFKAFAEKQSVRSP